MGAWSWGLVAVSASSSKFDVDGGDVELLEPVDDVDGGLHGGVGGGLVAICLDFHAAGDSREGLSAGEIGDVDEGIVPGCEDVADSEDISAGILRAEGSLLLGINSLLGSLFSLSSLLLGLLGRSDFRFSSLHFSLDFSHNINLIFYI